jgi:hypothetical protein
LFSSKLLFESDLKSRQVKLIKGILLCLLFMGNKGWSQVNPPQPLSIYVTPGQGLNFGAFFQGITGGLVIIYPDGSRSVTGDIVQASLGFPFSPAIFEVEANPGTLINIMNGPNIQLSGSNGGYLNMQLGGSDPASPIITTATPPARTTVRIGGTLTVGSPLANPSGSYNGTFLITFVQQ